MVKMSVVGMELFGHQIAIQTRLQRFLVQTRLCQGVPCSEPKRVQLNMFKQNPPNLRYRTRGELTGKVLMPQDHFAHHLRTRNGQRIERTR